MFGSIGIGQRGMCLGFTEQTLVCVCQCRRRRRRRHRRRRRRRCCGSVFWTDFLRTSERTPCPSTSCCSAATRMRSDPFWPSTSIGKLPACSTATCQVIEKQRRTAPPCCSSMRKPRRSQPASQSVRLRAMYWNFIKFTAATAGVRLRLRCAVCV